MTTAVEVIGLTKRFNNRYALNEVSISVKSGEMVALLGASGSGKSTLMRHLPGFITADNGEVNIFGTPVQTKGRLTRKIRHVRSQIGFVFQQFNLVNRLPVITNVLMGLLYHTASWRSLLMRFSVAQRQQALEALVSVGIEQTAWQRAATLSGGQQQRAALARCLVQKARLILADEPIASLDPESSRNVMELLTRMNQEHQCTVLVSLHQVEFAIKYCPRTIALNQGKIVFDGPSSRLTPALLEQLYGTDATQLLEPGQAPHFHSSPPDTSAINPLSGTRSEDEAFVLT